MPLPNVVAFAGRMRSGKTTCAKYLETKGYTVVNFADVLKDNACKILMITRGDLDKGKDVDRAPWRLHFHQMAVARNVLGPDFPDREYTTYRSFLQGIGPYCDNIGHVKALVATGAKVAIGDMRMPAEVALVRSVGGICVFLVNPRTPVELVSNHWTETAIGRRDLDVVLVNNGSLAALYRMVDNLDSPHGGTRVAKPTLYDGIHLDSMPEMLGSYYKENPGRAVGIVPETICRLWPDASVTSMDNGLVCLADPFLVEDLKGYL